MTDTSTGLLLRVRDPADHLAWSRLVDLYTPLLAAWVRRAGVPPQDADDVIQDVLLAVAREMPCFQYDRDRGSFRGWLRTVLAHRVRTHLRGRSAVWSAEPTPADVLDALEDPHSDLAHTWDREHDQHVAARLLQAVRPEFREETWAAFSRVVLAGERPAEVAASLGLSVGSVYQARSRVLARLRIEATGLLE